MPQKSVLEQLPPETLAACNRVLQTSGMTIEKAVPLFEELGVRVSKSAIGRHKKKIEDVAEDLRRSRVIAEAVGRDLADTGEDKLTSLNIELLQNEVFKLVTQARDQEEGDPAVTLKQLSSLSGIAFNLAAASKSNADRLIRVRREMAEKAAKAAVEELKEREPGMSAETVEVIKKRILGLAQ